MSALPRPTSTVVSSRFLHGPPEIFPGAGRPQEAPSHVPSPANVIEALRQSGIPAFMGPKIPLGDPEPEPFTETEDMTPPVPEPSVPEEPAQEPELSPPVSDSPGIPEKWTPVMTKAQLSEIAVRRGFTPNESTTKAILIDFLKSTDQSL